MAFMQIIEYRTSKPDQATALMEEWLKATEGKRTATRGMTCADRDDSGRYFQMVEFPSYEAAMENSKLPETEASSEEWMAICDGPPTFYNLDVTDSRDF